MLIVARVPRIKTAIAAILVIAAMADGATSQDVSPRPESNQQAASRPYLNAATKIAHWLDSVAIRNRDRISWPVNPGEQARTAHHLYSGTAGVVLFYLELYRATGDDAYLNTARAGARTLIAELDHVERVTPPGLWVGYSGYGYVLGEMFLATGDEVYRNSAYRVVELLDQWSTRERFDGEVRLLWNEVTDIISGSAGIGLFLLYADHQLGHPKAFDMSIEAANSLVGLAEPVVPRDDPEEILFRWQMTAGSTREMPNYSHGTAGVLDFLAALTDRARRRGDNRSLEKFDLHVRQSQKYLKSLGDHDEGPFRIFHHAGDGEDLFYLGWCHGPCGTNRAMMRANPDQLPPEVGASIEYLLSTEIPIERPAGFWNNVGLCCGSAGVISFLIDVVDCKQSYGDRDQAIRDRSHQMMELLVDDLLKRSTRIELSDGRTGLKWIQAEHRVRPELLEAQTGMMQGAAGIGLTLLKIDAREQNREFRMQLPISPY